MFLRIQSGVISTIPTSGESIDAKLKRVYVSQSKENFSAVERSHSVVGVCKMFGCFIKFVVNITETSDDLTYVSKRYRDESHEFVQVPSGKGLPPLTKEKNRKDSMNY